MLSLTAHSMQGVVLRGNTGELHNVSILYLNMSDLGFMGKIIGWVFFFETWLFFSKYIYLNGSSN